MILVDCISTFRIRYVIDTDSHDWAWDTVAMEEATEFSQLHLGEQIVSSRAITKEEYITLFDEDNEYLSEWEDDMKLRSVTEIK